MNMSQIRLINCNQQNFSRNGRPMKLSLRRVLIPVAVGINLLSACALRSDSSYSTKMSELDAPAAEALVETNQGTGAKETAPNETDSPPAELVENLKTVLAAETGVPIAEILLKETASTQWNDACLGAANPNEICAQVITSGYRIALGTSTETYIFHTDQTGENVRWVNHSRSETRQTQQESQ